VTVRERSDVAKADGASDADLRPRSCGHAAARNVTPWRGGPGTAGTVTVVGAGKMGLPLAGQYAAHGWQVVAVDIDPAVVEAINAGRSHVDEPGLDELVADAHGAGRLRATSDAADAAAQSDVVVLIVPIVIDDAARPDRRAMDAAVAAIGPGLRPGTLVVFETTTPVGDTRRRYAPRLVADTGLAVETAGDDGLLVAFSPERIYSGAALANLATYPKLVGGLGPRSTGRAVAFYESVLDADVVAMSTAEAAEFAKLAETTYRDVNIALANEFARVAEDAGLDVTEVIAAANSQPYSHIHQPGLGVGGHCIPVYPHFLLAGDTDLALVALARRVNDDQTHRAVDALRQRLDGLEGRTILVLGLTYRAGVKELAYSRALPLIAELTDAGATVRAFDPLLDAAEIERTGARPWTWGATTAVDAIVSQTADPLFEELDPAWFPSLRLVIDGRNSLAGMRLPAGVEYRGIGVTRPS
jgi:UDP-N-acetyl-D-mannosaminuronic acid dehydrogenase